MTCYLYVIGREEGPVKVGISNGPGGRLATIQTSCPFQVYLFHAEPMPSRERALYEEKHIHGIFEQDRLIGEWFDVEPDIVIEQIEFTKDIEEYYRQKALENAAHT